MVADGGDRRDARRPPGRRQRRDERHHDPQDDSNDDRPGLDLDPAAGQVDAEALEQSLEASSDEETEGEADDRREHADRQRLDGDGARHLSAAGADSLQEA